MIKIKQYKKVISLYEDLIKKHEHVNSWFIETNRNYMKLEEQNYYLKWKVEYLEKHIKKNNPDAKLYAEDDSEYQELKKDVKGVMHDK